MSVFCTNLIKPLLKIPTIPLCGPFFWPAPVKAGQALGRVLPHSILWEDGLKTEEPPFFSTGVHQVRIQALCTDALSMLLCNKIRTYLNTA